MTDSPRKVPGKWKWIGIGTGAAAVLIVAISVSMARTSTTEYCLSCHEMGKYKTELKKSSHAVDENDNPIACKQCHIPNTVGPRYLIVKTFSGMRDLAVHYLGDPENLDRRELQQKARRFIVDDNCLECHPDLFKGAKGEKKISDIGRLSHEAYLGINGTTSRNCAGCHFNMAHLPDFDRRYFFNENFAERLPPMEERNNGGE